MRVSETQIKTKTETNRQTKTNKKIETNRQTKTETDKVRGRPRWINVSHFLVSPLYRVLSLLQMRLILSIFSAGCLFRIVSATWTVSLASCPCYVVVDCHPCIVSLLHGLSSLHYDLATLSVPLWTVPLASCPLASCPIVHALWTVSLVSCPNYSLRKLPPLHHVLAMWLWTVTLVSCHCYMYCVPCIMSLVCGLSPLHQCIMSLCLMSTSCELSLLCHVLAMWTVSLASCPCYVVVDCHPCIVSLLHGLCPLHHVHAM